LETAKLRDGETDDKRITDWLPVELVFKNPDAGC
jgi:hypothetical protein